MSTFSSRTAAIWESPYGPVPPDADLAVLGSGIKYLPPLLWKSRMLFRGALDRIVKKLTGDFPHTLGRGKTTHPLFVLKSLPNPAHRVCPCSSKDWGARRVIRKGCRLEYTGQITERDTFLVESCSFNLHMDSAFTNRLFFLGRVPEECIETRDS